MGRWTRPLRIALTHTRTVCTLPSMTILMRCRFGLKVRLVMPVTLRPTPPKYFALPRRAYLLPLTGFLPVMAHCMPMAQFLSRKYNAQKNQYSNDTRIDKPRGPRRAGRQVEHCLSSGSPALSLFQINTYNYRATRTTSTSTHKPAFFTQAISGHGFGALFGRFGDLFKWALDSGRCSGIVVVLFGSKWG